MARELASQSALIECAVDSSVELFRLVRHVINQALSVAGRNG